MKIYTFLILFVLTLFIFVGSCKKETATKNPYDDINRNINDVAKKQIIDSNSIVGLHTLIFASKCAIPSCHGGPFEPDFRTPISSYNTMVYQKVTKNNAAGKFVYRVLPYDTTMSWLHERLVTDDSILGRMPRYLPALSANEMKHINQWILDGAKDVNGVAAKKPNNNIQLSYMFAIKQPFIRLDTSRINNYYPFETAKNTDMEIYFYVTDDESKGKDFLDTKVKFSTSVFDFSNAIAVTPILDTVISPGNSYFVAKVNSNQFVANKQIYMRFYGRDPDHPQIVEFPNSIAVSYYHSYYSFIVK